MEEQNKKKQSFNAEVQPRTLTAFNAKYDELVEYSAKNGYDKPTKKAFATYVIDMSLDAITPEVFFTKSKT